MLALTNHIMVETTKAPQFMDITQDVKEFVRASRIQNGCVVIYSKHTTAAIKINENEPLLLEDMERLLQSVASIDGHYHHNALKGEPPNGHAHCQHLFMSSSENIPIIDGELQLGRWQSVFLVELDSPRAREVVLQALGQ